MRFAAIICLSLAFAASTETTARAQDLSSFFKNTNGAFVLYDLKNDHYVHYNEARCRERFTPKSTFKIPNSLIGLETGVIRDICRAPAWFWSRYETR